MKLNLLLTVLAAAAINLTAIAGDNSVTINTQKSILGWKAKKVGGEHDGTVQITKGDLKFKDGELAGGSFEIDMTSIGVTDIENPAMNAKLVNHLKSEDFFGVEDHPTAKMVITSVKKNSDGTYEVTADFTIKGTTKSVKFPADIGESDSGPVAYAQIELDRTDYDVRYGSKTFFPNIGDKFIYDNFTLEVKLVW